MHEDSLLMSGATQSACVIVASIDIATERRVTTMVLSTTIVAPHRLFRRLNSVSRGIVENVHALLVSSILTWVLHTV
ncbi:hypothetical protein TNCV_2762291 [Trichonephila clavipes]|nr:hypothetical protein TNCV_2762291 [Trichonephila clavipes]